MTEMGGSVEIWSQPGKGTHVLVDLSLPFVALRPREPESERQPTLESTPPKLSKLGYTKVFPHKFSSRLTEPSLLREAMKMMSNPLFAPGMYLKTPGTYHSTVHPFDETTVTQRPQECKQIFQQQDPRIMSQQMSENRATNQIPSLSSTSDSNSDSDSDSDSDSNSVSNIHYSEFFNLNKAAMRYSQSALQRSISLLKAKMREYPTSFNVEWFFKTILETLIDTYSNPSELSPALQTVLVLLSVTHISVILYFALNALFIHALIYCFWFLIHFNRIFCKDLYFVLIWDRFVCSVMIFIGHYGIYAGLSWETGEFFHQSFSGGTIIMFFIACISIGRTLTNRVSLIIFLVLWSIFIAAVSMACDITGYCHDPQPVEHAKLAAARTFAGLAFTLSFLYAHWRIQSKRYSVTTQLLKKQRVARFGGMHMVCAVDHEMSSAARAMAAISKALNGNTLHLETLEEQRLLGSLKNSILAASHIIQKTVSLLELEICCVAGTVRHEDMESVLKNVVKTYNEKIENADLGVASNEITLAIKSKAPRTIRFDVEYLRYVLFALLENADQACQGSRITITVSDIPSQSTSPQSPLDEEDGPTSPSTSTNSTIQRQYIRSWSKYDLLHFLPAHHSIYDKAFCGRLESTIVPSFFGGPAEASVMAIPTTPTSTTTPATIPSTTSPTPAASSSPKRGGTTQQKSADPNFSSLLAFHTGPLPSVFGNRFDTPHPANLKSTYYIGGQLSNFQDCDWSGIRITVQDMGPGVDLEEIPYVFEPFSSPSVKNSSRPSVSLYIAKEITHRLGGRLGLRSYPGIGASFFIDLPAHSIYYPDRSLTPTRQQETHWLESHTVLPAQSFAGKHMGDEPDTATPTNSTEAESSFSYSSFARYLLTKATYVNPGLKYHFEQPRDLGAERAAHAKHHPMFSQSWYDTHIPRWVYEKDFTGSARVSAATCQDQPLWQQQQQSHQSHGDAMKGAGSVHSQPSLTSTASLSTMLSNSTHITTDTLEDYNTTTQSHHLEQQHPSHVSASGKNLTISTAHPVTMPMFGLNTQNTPSIGLASATSVNIPSNMSASSSTSSPSSRKILLSVTSPPEDTHSNVSNSSSSAHAVAAMGFDDNRSTSSSSRLNLFIPPSFQKASSTSSFDSTSSSLNLRPSSATTIASLQNSRSVVESRRAHCHDRVLADPSQKLRILVIDVSTSSRKLIIRQIESLNSERTCVIGVASGEAAITSFAYSISTSKTPSPTNVLVGTDSNQQPVSNTAALLKTPSVVGDGSLFDDGSSAQQLPSQGSQFASNSEDGSDEESNRFDLILIDNSVDSKAGSNTANKIREIEQSAGISTKEGVAIVVVTNTVPHLSSSPFDDYLAKPIKILDIQALISEYLPIALRT